MSKVGEFYKGFWPERPLDTSKVVEGDWVRYSLGGRVKRAQVAAVSRSTVCMSDGGWCYLHELSEDRD